MAAAQNIDIKFIWIEEYNILHNIGFNFHHSGDHTFRYMGEKLELLPNPKTILDFGNCITGLTAIAGQNGSGKSSLCEAVIRTTATVADYAGGYSLEFKGIVCYGQYVFRHKDILIGNEEEIGEYYELVVFEKTPFEKMSQEWMEYFKDKGFVYYSNVIDRRSAIWEQNLTNISTQEQLSNAWHYAASIPDHNKIIELKSQGATNRETKSLLAIYFEQEAHNHAEFYLAFPNFLPFTIPSHFIFQSTYSGNSRWLSVEKMEGDQAEIIRELQDRILSNINSSRKWIQRAPQILLAKDQIKTIIHQLFRLNVIIICNSRHKSILSRQEIERFVIDRESAESFFNDGYLIDIYLETHWRLIEAALIDNVKFDPSSVPLIYDDMVDWRFKLVEHIYIPNNQITLKLLKDFIATERSLMSEPYFKRLVNLMLYPYQSSGELSFLTLFSRLYEFISRHQYGNSERKNFILFIDEAEVGFHPAWKKSLLKWLINFINLPFHDFKCQIILTTHSPYLLSDLTPNHIILLKKNTQGKTIQVPSTDFATFGANIHDLLATSFFLEDGSIGEFAKEQIQKTIDTLNAWKRQFDDDRKEFELRNIQWDSDKNQVRNVIGVIADPIVRNKLFDMYWELFQRDALIERELGMLQRRINTINQNKRHGRD